MAGESTIEQSVPISSPLPQVNKLNGLKITVVDYDESHYHEAEVSSIEDCFVFRAQPTVTWIHIVGLTQADKLEKLGDCYGFHPLVLEDILSDQRPKVEDYDDYIFVVLKTLYYQETESELEADQISIIMGPNYVVSFTGKEGDIVRPVRDRLRTGKGRIRRMGADYLAYSMIDAIVDHYFTVAEKLGEMFEDVEDAVVTKPDPETLPAIYNIKRNMLFLRKSVWPLREAISHLQRTESQLISETTKIYLRDVYDHTIQIIENIETLRDMSASLLDTYISSLSNRLNDVIKLLTIISTIFIPLTFISGVYGMNFEHMPMLQSAWGYPVTVAFMAVVAGVMLSYFKRKKWI
jgi:magnesium transporter